MIKELEIKEFQRVKNLFQGVYFNLNSLAVINGDSEGRVWIDDIDNPKTGLLVDNVWCSYLTGDSNNKEFNQEASKIIKELIFPKAAELSEETNPEFNNNEWVIYYDDDKWNEIIENEMEIKDFLALKRCYYILDKLKIPNWRDMISEGCSVERVDSHFLEKSYLKNMQEVTNWIKESWKSTEDFLERGFGFCMVEKDQDIVCYGMADWATENKAEMGIGTVQQHRRKGYATIVVSAAAEYCIDKGLELGWHCSEHNTASWKTAEKAGLKKDRNYNAAIGCFDEFQNLIENAWYKALYLDKPKEGLRYAEKLVEHERVQVDQWLLYALILARNKKNKEAIEIFSKSIDLGIENPTRLLENLTTRDDLKEMREETDWTEITTKLESLIKEKKQND